MKPLETISQEVADIARQQRPVYATVMGALIEAREPLLKEIQQLQEENQRLKEALTGLMKNPSIDLGDMAYRVKEAEAKGWEGPDVIAWGQAVQNARKLIEP